MTFPMLMISNMLYSLWDEEDHVNNIGKWLRILQSAFMKGFSWDILDVAELTFEDFGCFQTYEQGWLVAFDIFLLVSIILTSFICGIEQPKKKIECQDKTITVLKLLFNDVSLLILRLAKIMKQGHPYGSIIFLTKEVLSIISRFVLLCCFCCDNNNTDYNKLPNSREDNVAANRPLMESSEFWTLIQKAVTDQIKIGLVVPTNWKRRMVRKSIWSKKMCLLIGVSCNFLCAF